MNTSCHAYFLGFYPNNNDIVNWDDRFRINVLFSWNWGPTNKWWYFHLTREVCYKHSKIIRDEIIINNLVSYYKAIKDEKGRH